MPYVYLVFALLQIFFLQGRFIFGPDVRSLGLTILLIVAPVTIFCVFVARRLMDHYSDHLGELIMAVAVVFTVYVSSLIFNSLVVLYVFTLDWTMGQYNVIGLFPLL